MFREGGYNPEAAKLQYEQKKASKEHENKLKQAENERMQKEISKQVEQFADATMDKAMEIPAIAERYQSDKAFQMEVNELKGHLMKARDLEQAQKIVDAFSADLGEAMQDFMPAVVGTEYLPPEEPQPFKNEELGA